MQAIPDPHDCPGIDVLESPSKHPAGLSLLRASCTKPVTHSSQQKNSAGPELVQKFQKEGRQLDFPTLHFLRAGAWGQKQFWGHHFSVSPHTCHSDGSPQKSLSFLCKKHLALHIMMLLHNSLVSGLFLLSVPGILRIFGLVWLGRATKPTGKQRQGGLRA